MTDFRRYIILFITGAVGYCLIELLWRGRTHPSMALLGGICLIVIHAINSVFCTKSCAFRALLCAMAISLIEFTAGIILNVVLRLDVWDYSRQPLNIMGQVCPLYSMLWFFLSFVIIYIGGKIPFFR